jgi:hypothetical protein
MSDLGKRPPDANATIQLDQLADADQVALVEDGDAAGDLGPPRSLPPPLPLLSQQQPSGSQSASKPPVAPAAQPRSTGRVVAYAVAFVALLAGAIAAGLVFGRTLGGDSTTVTTAAVPAGSRADSTGPRFAPLAGSRASDVPVAPPSAKPVASASAPRDTLVLPTVELKSGE